MTHLLATLLTGGRFDPVARREGTPPAKAASGEAFGRVLEEAGARNESAEGDRSRPAAGGADRADQRADGPPRQDGGGTTGNAGEGAPLPGTRITILGAVPGARPNLPSLTFVLPAGSGTADLTTAVRAQVLRTVAARQLDPGALNNLRLAISTRELGQVDVQLNAAGDRLKIEITAAGREAETALRRSSGDLKDAVLARSDRFRQVEVRVDGRTLAESDEGQEENPGRSGRDRQEREDGRNARQGDRDRGSGPEA